MNNTNGVFDIYSPEEFFYSITNALENYKRAKQKSIEILLFTLMGLNHLREWIAPGYNPQYKCGKKHWKTPSTDAERFSKVIYDNASFKIIRSLCNRTKHLKRIEMNTYSNHDVPLDDWSDIDAVRNFDKGPASDYFVDGTNIIKIIDEVIDSYRKEWFEKKGIIFK